MYKIICFYVLLLIIISINKIKYKEDFENFGNFGNFGHYCNSQNPKLSSREDPTYLIWKNNDNTQNPVPTMFDQKLYFKQMEKYEYI